MVIYAGNGPQNTEVAMAVLHTPVVCTFQFFFAICDVEESL